MKAKISKKLEIAKGTLYVEYKLVDEQIEFKSGQFFHVLLKEDIKHHFTIVNSPNQKGIVAMATRLRDTVFKNTLRDLPVGSEVEIYKIKGEFVLPEKTNKQLVFIALGIGITPYISMLRSIIQDKLPFSVTLMYSDSDRASMAFLEELETYTKDIPNFTFIKTITKDPQWKGEKRQVDEAFIQAYIQNPLEKYYYVSGPPSAVESVVAVLSSMSISSEQMKAENFTGYS